MDKKIQYTEEININKTLKSEIGKTCMNFLFKVQNNGYKIQPE